MSSWIPSSLISERVFFGTVLVVVLCVGLCVVGRCWLWLCCEADGTSPCTALSVPHTLPRLCRFGHSMVVFGVVLVELTGSCVLSWCWLDCHHLVHSGCSVFVAVSVVSNQNVLLNFDSQYVGPFHSGLSLGRQRCVDWAGSVVLS